MFFQFHDMHSGGGQKLEWSHIFIEAESEREAIDIFENHFGRCPTDASCDTCGDDYSISDSEDLQQATAYERGCKFVTSSKQTGGGRYVEEADGRYQEFVPYKMYLKTFETDGLLGRQKHKVIYKDKRKNKRD